MVNSRLHTPKASWPPIAQKHCSNALVERAANNIQRERDLKSEDTYFYEGDLASETRIILGEAFKMAYPEASEQDIASACGVGIADMHEFSILRDLAISGGSFNKQAAEKAAKILAGEPIQWALIASLKKRVA